MKKSLLTFVAALMVMTVSAQNYDYFEFVDKDGNAVPDGATLTLTEVTQEEDVFTGDVISYMYSHLKVRNKTTEERALRIIMTIDRMDNGTYQLCFPLVCKSFDEETMVETEGGVLLANETKDLQTEWIPDAEGGCDVTLAIEVLNKVGFEPNVNYVYVADGPTVTLRYRNGINDEMPCDVTGDGIVDIADVNAAINVMLGKEPNSKYDGRADINGDDNVDIADVNAIINAMLGK